MEKSQEAEPPWKGRWLTEHPELVREVARVIREGGDQGARLGNDPAFSAAHCLLYAGLLNIPDD